MAIKVNVLDMKSLSPRYVRDVNRLVFGVPAIRYRWFVLAG